MVEAADSQRRRNNISCINTWYIQYIHHIFRSKLRTASIHRPSPHHHTLPTRASNHVEHHHVANHHVANHVEHHHTLPRPLARQDNMQVGQRDQFFLLCFRTLIWWYFWAEKFSIIPGYSQAVDRRAEFRGRSFSQGRKPLAVNKEVVAVLN